MPSCSIIVAAASLPICWFDSTSVAFSCFDQPTFLKLAFLGVLIAFLWPISAHVQGFYSTLLYLTFSLLSFLLHPRVCLAYPCSEVLSDTRNGMSILWSTLVFLISCANSILSYKALPLISFIFYMTSFHHNSI